MTPIEKSHRDPKTCTQSDVGIDHPSGRLHGPRSLDKCVHEGELSRDAKLISFQGLKGSPQEVMNRVARSLVNHGYIGRCIAEARDGLRRFIPSISIDRDRNYQLSNRIASAWKLVDCGMPTVLHYLGFSGDYGMEGSRCSNRFGEITGKAAFEGI
jgi:hypothetical protein